jgi:hypothetical protein
MTLESSIRTDDIYSVGSAPELTRIPGLQRIEQFSREAMAAHCMEETRAVYPHDMVYGRFCTIEEYINCPPDLTFEYLADPYSLHEWTWSTRNFKPTETPGLLVGSDELADNTRLFCKTVTNTTARTVDYHCAWDQGDELWMIYLMRVIDAQLVFGKSGSVITWSNCHHPNYDDNPHPDTAPTDRDIWVGDLWPMFYAGHVVEMQNLKKILEYRNTHNLPIRPWVG